jgi:elongation factor G
MRGDIEVPEEYMGDVMGDISSRRGRIEGMEARSNTQHIIAKVPLSQMFGYATALRSRTQGRGTFMMQISHFEEVPKSIMEELLKK